MTPEALAGSLRYWAAHDAAVKAGVPKDFADVIGEAAEEFWDAPFSHPNGREPITLTITSTYRDRLADFTRAIAKRHRRVDTHRIDASDATTVHFVYRWGPKR